MLKTPLGIDEIRAILPHRYPMLMIDRVIEVTENGAIAEKLVSANEPYFRGHFPDRPIMPGVLIIEALAQAGGIWAVLKKPENQGKGTALAGIDRARFRHPVVPGDTLALHVEVTHQRGPVTKFQGVARVRGETVAEATLLAAFVDWAKEGA